LDGYLRQSIELNKHVFIIFFTGCFESVLLSQDFFLKLIAGL